MNGDCPSNTQLCPYSEKVELKNRICIKVNENIPSEEQEAFLEKNCPINKVYIVSHDSDQFADFKEVPINSDLKIVYSKKENELPLVTLKVD